MAINVLGHVAQDTLQTTGEGQWAALKSSKRGDMIVIDWYRQMALEGRCYNVRAGTVTTPLVGDVAITTAAAEMCADAATGTTIIPCYLNIGVRLGTGTLHEYAAKSEPAVSTAGTAFVPLNLLLGGAAATSTARVGAAGAVTVTAEAVTTTRRHWHYANPLAVAAGNEVTTLEWKPVTPPVDVGPGCFYVQIAATTTGPSYYANFDYVELPTTAIS
jgi:hypothetical protein